MATRALVLFAHGARAQSWAEPFERLRALTAARLPECEVSLAFLELLTPSLADDVAALATRGVLDITVVPVFFGMGGHLRRDLPLIVDALRARFPQLSIKVAGPVGEDPGVQAAMADYCIASMS
jgi:sirohydrochlorin cobaltochelatase